MSNKAFRLLQQEREKLAADSKVQNQESEDEIEESTPKKNIRNVFDLLREDSENDDHEDNEELGLDEVASKPSLEKQKKSKKKKKNKAKVTKGISGDNGDLEAVLNEIGLESSNKTIVVAENSASSSSDVLKVEHKYLDHENELKKIFGAHIIENNKRNNRSRNVRRYRLVNLRRNWGGIEKSGVSMDLVERRGDEMYFVIEHSRAYREVQLIFLEAVESADPTFIMNLARQYPFHIDSLLQICEICKMSEDWEAATEIIERALHIFERGFHPLFSLTQGTCRLEYTRRENRGFYLSLFQHLIFLSKKGCYRTCLEFCKLIYSLSPDSDPLGMLLMMDMFALKSGEYEFLIDFYDRWNVNKNLFQLPNFAFSYPLALFNRANQTKDDDMMRLSDEKLQDALLMYPGMLHSLLEKCSIAPDDDVNKHEYFKGRSNDPEALKLLIRLYVLRTFSSWKDAKVMRWMERNVHKLMMSIGDLKDKVEHYSQCRATRYVGTPRNVYRHLFVSDVKDLSYQLPPALTVQSINHYDPLPPPNSTSSYEQLNRSSNRNQAESRSVSSVFLQSLFPSFNPNDVQGGAAAGNGEGVDLTRTVGAFMDGLRSLVNSIRYTPPNNEEQEENPDDDWDEEEFD